MSSPASSTSARSTTGRACPCRCRYGSARRPATSGRRRSRATGSWPPCSTAFCSAGQSSRSARPTDGCRDREDDFAGAIGRPIEGRPLILRDRRRIAGLVDGLDFNCAGELAHGEPNRQLSAGADHPLEVVPVSQDRRVFRHDVRDVRLALLGRQAPVAGGPRATEVVRSGVRITLRVSFRMPCSRTSPSSRGVNGEWQLPL